jgi:gamma-glutamyl hercynylcysteine S-oxide synthase
MTKAAINPRQLSGQALVNALIDSRARTWALVADLTDAQWCPPQQPGVNPVAWELAHLAWFAEFWILRGPHSRGADGFAHAARVPRFAGPDALFDSAQLAHASRWTEPMPTRARLEKTLQFQLDACVETILATDTLTGADADQALYFHRLALFHEDMHGEAFCWTRNTLGYPAPPEVSMPRVQANTPISIGGGRFLAGHARDATGFAFDNEARSLDMHVDDFTIDSAPVSATEFARFVDAGGYKQPKFWPAAAGQWLAQSGLAQPHNWRRSSGGDWQMRWFDQWLMLAPDAPAMHLNAFEAEAYCLWAGRRLPTALEWEYAAQTEAAFSWGHSVWEWTADMFTPYPGFEPGPYREYSQPWFGDHRELRGGAFATHRRMHHPCYRNFFQAHRCDIFAGFRTVA